jgi:hypothetical protein
MGEDRFDVRWVVSRLGLAAAAALMLSACQPQNEAAGGDTPVGAPAVQPVIAPNSGSADQPVASSDAKPSTDSGDTPISGAATIAIGVAGRVVNASGQPVVNALVTAEAVSPPGLTVPELAVMTGATGQYEWPLQDGVYDLRVVVAGSAPVVKRVTVKGAVTPLDITLR